MQKTALTMISAITLILSPTVSADVTVTFELIPNALGANDMSPDGRYVVGEADWNGDGFPDGSYLWDSELDIMTDLAMSGDPTLTVPVVAVSDDGNVVLGNMTDPNEPNGFSTVAAMWTQSTGWQSLGYLPNAGHCPSRSSAYEISADGTVAVGLSWDGCDARAINWSQATGMQEMERLFNGSNRASVISADGTLAGGFAQGSFSRTPAIWDVTTGDGTLLDPNGNALGEVHGMNDAGTILLGTWLTTELAGLASKWTPGPGPTGWTREQISSGSFLPGWEGIPMDIADSGRIVGFDFLVGNRRAWIIPDGTGPILDLKTYVEDNGGTVPEELILEVCQAISTDGKYIVGHGFATGAWRVAIDEVECTGDVNGDNAVDLTDLAIVLGNFGLSPADPEDGDLDGDGDVDVSDLAIVLANFGASCS